MTLTAVKALRWHFTDDAPVKRRTALELGRALFSLSQTERRLAHRAKREALEAEAHGKTLRYQTMRAESDRLWRNAKTHLSHARREFER